MVDWQSTENLIQEIIDLQHKRLLACGRQIIPHITSDDILQPNDFPELENHPVFRYEEGVLAGLQSLQIALRALQRTNNSV